jgi:tartrate dehydrogenase/decarboxylase / D-malate dehydrogenase
LEHLGEKETARTLSESIDRALRDRANHSRDIGGTATTRQVTDAIIEEFDKTQRSPGGW